MKHSKAFALEVVVMSSSTLEVEVMVEVGICKYREKEVVTDSSKEKVVVEIYNSKEEAVREMEEVGICNNMEVVVVTCSNTGKEVVETYSSKDMETCKHKVEVAGEEMHNCKACKVHKDCHHQPLH
ncbi:unnamed protein product, partial [Vitis vinifera]|uniref:Uncharacterized protein n=1 Tax=Vitis vinifera TaxID=29760 RepID=D7SL61_VITVI